MSPSSDNPLDQYFSPFELASSIADLLAEGLGDARYSELDVVDFCAGAGSLLDAVSARIPAARIFATDLDGSCVRLLRKVRPSWKVGQIDLFNERSRRSSLLYREQFYSAFVLNPPFSGRGVHVESSSFAEGLRFVCSRPLACLLLSLRALRIGGYGVAVLPLSCLRSDRDAHVVRWLSSHMNLTVHSYNGRGCFPDAAAQTVVVSVRRNCLAQPVSSGADGFVLPRVPEGFSGLSGESLTLFRGKVPVRFRTRVASGGEGGVAACYVHTTDLKHPLSTWTSISVSRDVCLVRDCVLFPRVGKISKGSFRMYSGSVPLILSDCLFALSPNSEGIALTDLFLTLQDNCDSFVTNSQATGAPYLTISQICAIVDSLGFSVSIHQCRDRCLYRD